MLSSLGYSGEFYDTAAQQQYLRARFYNPDNGRFNRLDPFAGNVQDPQSLHKYAYVHGDPIQFVDPTGLRVLGATVASIAIATVVIGLVVYSREGSDRTEAGGEVINISFGFQYDPEIAQLAFRLLPEPRRTNLIKEDFERNKDDAQRTARRSVEKLQHLIDLSTALYGHNSGTRVRFVFSAESIYVAQGASVLSVASKVPDFNNGLKVGILTNYRPARNQSPPPAGLSVEGSHLVMIQAENGSGAGPAEYTTLAHELGHVGEYRPASGKVDVDAPPGQRENHHIDVPNLMKHGYIGHEIDEEWALAIARVAKRF